VLRKKKKMGRNELKSVLTSTSRGGPSPDTEEKETRRRARETPSPSGLGKAVRGETPGELAHHSRGAYRDHIPRGENATQNRAAAKETY